MSSSEPTHQQIKSLVESDEVVLFMKGSRNFPQCGFSSTVVQILNGLVSDYKTVNVLSDPAIRQGIKDFSSWPTIPQLYVGGEFIGGCDIIRDMYSSGDLQKKLGVDAGSAEPPTITITAGAAEKLKEAMSDSEPGELIHLSVDAKFKAQLAFAKEGPAFVKAEDNGVTILVDVPSCKRAEGVTIDYKDSDRGPGFKIDNPNAPADVVELAVTEYKKMRDNGDSGRLYDVRTPKERDLAVIEGSVLLDDSAVAELDDLERETPLVFMCHTGVRSRAAAEHFRDLGFKTVYNLKGGIAAWSAEIDPSVPTY